MRERFLLKQALESQKASSKKAKSKLVSTNASPTSSKPVSRHGSTLNTPAMSRQVSQSGSRVNSDDDDYLSDDTIFSGSDLVNSIEDLGDATRDWEDNMRDRIEELIDWKRSSTEGRELCLRTFVRQLQAHYAEEVISSHEQDLVTSFLRSIKNESSEQEVLRALKAVEMLMLTSGESTVSEACSPTIQRLISHSDSIEIKTQAIRTWCCLTYYSGAEDEAIVEAMDFLIEIIESDGVSIEAEDAAEPVAAAIEGLSFLSTLVDDLSEQSGDYVDALVEQLDSTSPAVQVAAGEAIALLFEKSHTEPEDDEVVGEHNHTAILGDDEKVALIRRYQAANNYREVIGKLVQLSSTAGRSSRRKDVKAARVSFKDILLSIENPTYGPRYSLAESKEGGGHLGSRLNVKVGNSGVMKIDRWWKLICLHTLKRMLQAGFLEHYEHNPLVIETLPVILTRTTHHKK